MSFLRGVKRARERYGLRRRDGVMLVAHYPLFRAHHERYYGKGVGRALGALAGRAASDHAFDIVARSATGPIRVPVSFASSDLDSFLEVFMAEEYTVPFSTVSTYVDLGANTGMAALSFACRHPLEKALLVEANPDLMTKLATVVERTHGVACLVHAAVTPEPGMVNFDIRTNHRYSRIGTRAEGVEVRGSTLRTLLDEHDFPSVDVLKVDIEGAEHDVLRSDPQVLLRCRVIVMELHGEVEERDASLALLRSLPFDVEVDRRGPIDLVVAVAAPAAVN